jgi:aminotransferase
MNLAHATLGIERRFARTAYMKLSPIKEIELAASRIPGVVSLAQGIPSFDTPEPIKTFVRQKIAEGACAKYSLTPGLPQLREVIAESLLRDGMRYDPDNEIIVTCGSIEGIASTLLTLTQPGDEVILPTPSYASYQEIVRMAGCAPRFAALHEEANFAFDISAFEDCISSRTRAILYCNPNNPTGTVFSRAETLELVELAERHDLFLIIDEAYKDFVFNKEAYFSPSQLSAARSRIVRVYTFSKAYGMTGWRVGYLHSDASNVREILKIHDALVTCAPVVSQYAAIAALEQGEPHIAAFRRAFKERRDRTVEHLDRLSHIFDYQKPEGAYFVFPRVKDTVRWARDSRQLTLDILERAKVALVSGIAFGPSGESHLRINFGRELTDIDLAFARLDEYFHVRSSLPAATTTPQTVAQQQKSRRYRFRHLAVPYLQTLARVFLRRTRPKVIAIAGSRGKTVIKRVLGELLERRYRVRTNPRSYNTEIGLPLAVLNLEIDTRNAWTILHTLARAAWTALFSPERPEILILELGVRQPGDMHQLLQTVRPDITVLTNLTPSYSNDIAFLQTLQDEIRVLCREVGSRCHFLVDGDDPLLKDVLPALSTPPVLLHRAQWSENGRGQMLQSDGHAYHVAREFVGESERVSIQAAVMLAERWTALTAEDISQFLSGEDRKEPHASANV